MSLYFTKPTDQLEHNGKTVGVINNGDLQTTVNEKLALELQELRSLINKMSVGSTPNSIDSSTVMNSSGFGQTNSYTDSGKKVTLTVTPASDRVEVFYDLNNAIEEGWEATAKVSVDGNRAGIKTVLIDSNKLSNGFVLAPNNFPAEIEFEVKLKKGDAVEVLSSKQTLLSGGDNNNYTLYKRQFGATNLQTQKDVNETLYREVQTLKKAVEPKTVKLSGVEQDLQKAIITLKTELDTLKAEMRSNTVA